MRGKFCDCSVRHVGHVSITGAVASERYRIEEMVELEERHPIQVI